MKLINIIKKNFLPKCKHEYEIKDIKFTNIPEPLKPMNGAYQDWVKYFKEYYDGDWNTKRVMCPCKKCGQIKYAHCGLDII